MTKAHRAYPLNCAPRIGYDWRIFCRECGDTKPAEIGKAERRSDALAIAAKHNSNVLA